MGRITWTMSRYGALRGTVGANTAELFTISPSTTYDDDRVELRGYLLSDRRRRFDTNEVAQEAAETWLAEHVRSLGAELLPRVTIGGQVDNEQGLDATCQDCGAGETAMSENYAERWAKTHRCGVDV